MKKLMIRITILGFFVLLALQVQATQPQTYDSIIYGAGDPAQDILNVQTAVNGGGSVLLRGSFDFGSGRVMILNDVEIYGETDNKGNPVTKISNGFLTFLSPLLVLPPTAPGPKIAIKNIHFDGARYTPIYIKYTSGADISGNRITNVNPRPVGPFSVQAGAILGSYTTATPNLQIGALTGNLVFSSNYVDLANANPSATLGQGVFINLTWGASIEISDNVVVNASRNALESLENYLDENGNGTITIRNNTLITPDVGFPWPSDSTPNGIVAGWVFNPAGATDPTINSNISVEHNYIEQGEANKCFAIFVKSSHASIRHNHILVGGGDEAKGVIIGGPNGQIANNRIEGSGQYALLVTSYENRLFGNNLNHFDPNEIGFDVGFGIEGNYNTLLGGKGTVEDLGTDNVIKGNWEIFP